MRRFAFLAAFFFTILCAAPTTAYAQVYDLYLTWVGVIDNGEGSGGLHGPRGNLHLQVFNAAGYELLHRVIEGPSKREFLDGDEGFYDLYLGTTFHEGPPFRVHIWESDPGGPLLGRTNDTLFDAWITSAGLWESHLTAKDKAVVNSRYRARHWLQRIGYRGVWPGMPAMWIEVVAQRR